MAIAEGEKTALVGIPEGAQIIGLHEESLRKAVAAGEIPGIRVGRLFKIPRWWIEEQLHGTANQVA